MNKAEETKFLNDLYQNYITSDDSEYLKFIRRAVMEKCLGWMKPGGIAMELGCEIGYMTELISPNVKQLDTIEGSALFIAQAAKRNLKNVVFYNLLFEDIKGENLYDYIFASHVIEHVENPGQVLRLMHKALKPGGMIFITVPNAYAASRQLALSMGLLTDLFELTPNDIRGGHRRVYSQHEIVNATSNAGFQVMEASGLLFKPFADFQMDELIDLGLLTEQHLNGLLKLGKIYSELCGAIFVVGRK